MLRSLVALLLLANGVLFGWSAGWFEPVWPRPHFADAGSEREPERLAAQVRPEALTVLTPAAASAVVVAARAAAATCVEAGPLLEADLPAAEALLLQAQMPDGSWQREAATPPLLWLVYAGRWPDAAARKAREEELRRLKLSFELLETPADLAPGILLSRHASRDAAEAALAALADKPLKGLRVANLPAPAAQTWLRVPRADGDIRTRLQALPGAALAGGFKACSARP